MIERLLRMLRPQRPLTSLSDAAPWQLDIATRVRPFTMTSPERIHATITAVEYIARQGIPGAIVECGVWKGGNMMAAALVLQHYSAIRPLYLFDTFEGMTAPGAVDADHSGTPARLEYERLQKNPKKAQWCEAGIEEVRANMASTGYPADQLYFVKGQVELTLPSAAPKQIALLRLDTDWYASTRHELEHLYPLVASGGVVAIDDYGHWQGARRAVDEYLDRHNICCLLHRIDYTAREFVKR